MRPIIAFCFVDTCNWVTSFQYGDIIHYSEESRSIQFIRKGKAVTMNLGLDGQKDRLEVGELDEKTYYAFVTLLAIINHAKGIDKMTDGKFPDYLITF